MKEQNNLVLFQKKAVRRVWYKEEWWFSIIDIVALLTEKSNPRRYWSDLKRKLTTEGYNELYDSIVQLKMQAPDGKMRKTDCANMENMFRIIQSISSPKAEPFKQWLAQVGGERIQEMENPELIAERARQYYRELGYSEDWIKKRMQSIEVRGKLTDEWKKRGVKEGKEYAILTSEISKGTFGLSPSQHKKHKELKKENLRDHMTDLELIFTMLGEVQTKQEAVKDDANGFWENKKAAKKGGEAAGVAREAFEKRTNQKVVSSGNFLQQIKTAIKKRKEIKKGSKSEDETK